MAEEDEKEEDDDVKIDASLDDDEEDGDEDESSEKGGSKKLLILIAIPLLLLGGGAAAYFTGVLDPYLGGAETSEEYGDDKHASADGYDKKGKGESKGGYGSGPYFLEMPNQRVNLNSEGGPPTFLQLNVQLELKSKEDKDKVEAVMPRVIDQFQTYLRELRVRDLKGSAGIYRLQSELLNRVNAAAAPVEVQDVLFQEILIQEN